VQIWYLFTHLPLHEAKWAKKTPLAVRWPIGKSNSTKVIAQTLLNENIYIKVPESWIKGSIQKLNSSRL
jgi:hypothetical protein